MSYTNPNIHNVVHNDNNVMDVESWKMVWIKFKQASDSPVSKFDMNYD